VSEAPKLMVLMGIIKLLILDSTQNKCPEDKLHQKEEVLKRDKM